MFSARWRCVLLFAPLLTSALGCAFTGGYGVVSHRPGSGITAAEREVRVAQLYERQGDTKRAAVWYNRALAHQPSHPEALKGLENIVAARTGKPRDITSELLAKKLKTRRDTMDAVRLAGKSAKQQRTASSASDSRVARAKEAAAAAVEADAIADLAVTERSRSPLVDAGSDDSDEWLGMDAFDDDPGEDYEVATTPNRLDSNTDAGSHKVAGIPVITPAENLANLKSPYELVAMLGEVEARTRSTAAFRLGQLRDSGEDHLPVLRDALARETDGSARVHLAEAIVRIDGSDAVAAAILIESMRTGDDDVRWLSALALEGTALSGNEEVCIALDERLGDTSPMVRAAAAMSLGAHGKSAEGSLKKLNVLLTDVDSDVKEAAAVAIECITGGTRTNDGVTPVNSVIHNSTSAKPANGADDFDFDLGEESDDFEL
jgi:hypothetical protein